MERRIVVEGREIMYELTAKKVKNLNLRVQPDGRITVSVPRGLSPGALGCCRRWSGRQPGGKPGRHPAPSCGENRWRSWSGPVLRPAPNW